LATLSDVTRSLLILVCLISSACRVPNQRVPATVAAPPTTRSSALQTNPITDLVLIYDGGEARQPWTVERFKPYVYRNTNGKFEWLYDGFLFLDRFSKTGARFSPISNRHDANKADWQSLIDNYFAPDQSIAALDQLLDQLAAQGHTPIRRRKIVIALPTPITGSTPGHFEISSEWGNVNGKKLDFHKSEDRLAAAQWYVKQVLKRWNEKHYRHVELAGFYWLFERAWTTDDTLDISRYIHAKGSTLYWIPSWPQGRTNWQQYGFDFVYQQPNYFFHRKPTPPDRLEQACTFAEKCGTSMEMEFNTDLLTKPQFLRYFDEYLASYHLRDVWQKRPVAYYEGAGTWSEMSKSNDPAVKKRYNALAAIIGQRQHEADEGFVFRQAAK
jgi:hypothetical protein